LIGLKPLLFQLLFQVVLMLLMNSTGLKPKQHQLPLQTGRLKPTKQTHQ
jgi:hypothetical protein